MVISYSSSYIIEIRKPYWALQTKNSVKQKVGTDHLKLSNFAQDDALIGFWRDNSFETAKDYKISWYLAYC